MTNDREGLVEDMPLPIQAFYYQRIDSEPTGKTVEEEYEYYGEDGNLQIGTRLVPEYHDVYYVAERERWDLKDWSYVEQAKNYEAKIHGIRKVCEAGDWAFFDEYVAWMITEPLQEQFLVWTPTDPINPVEGDGEYVYDQDAFNAACAEWQTLEPVNTSPDPDTYIRELHAGMAIGTRHDAIYDTLVIDRGPLDMGKGKDGVLGIDNLKDTLVAVDLGLDPSNGVDWIMADNTVENLSLEDIKNAIRDFNARKQAVFTQYGSWRSGDQLTPFSFNKGLY